MSRFQNFQGGMPMPPNISQTFQLNNKSYAVIDDILKLAPDNLPPFLSIENVLGLIPSIVYIDGWQYTVLFKGGCGDFLATEEGDKNHPMFRRVSYTGQLTCKDHQRACRCGNVICISGNADGMIFDPGNVGDRCWLCMDCHEEASKELRRRTGLMDFIRGLKGGKP